MMESGLWADDEGIENRRQIPETPKRWTGETSDRLDVVGNAEARVRDASEPLKCLVTLLT